MKRIENELPGAGWWAAKFPPPKTRSGGSYSKQKGSGYERVVAGLLDEYFGLPSHTFWRTLGSGNWKPEPADIQSRNTLLTQGINLAVECKFYKDIDLWAVLGGKKSDIVKWWRKLDQEGKGKLKLMFLRFNRSKHYISFDLYELNYEVAPMTFMVGGKRKGIMLWEDFKILVGADYLKQQSRLSETAKW